MRATKEQTSNHEMVNNQSSKSVPAHAHSHGCGGARRVSRHKPLENDIP